MPLKSRGQRFDWHPPIPVTTRAAAQKGRPPSAFGVPANMAILAGVAGAVSRQHIQTVALRAPGPSVSQTLFSSFKTANTQRQSEAKVRWDRAPAGQRDSSSHPAPVDRRPSIPLKALSQFGDQLVVGHELPIVVGDLVGRERLEAFRRRDVDAR